MQSEYKKANKRQTNKNALDYENFAEGILRGLCIASAYMCRVKKTIYVIENNWELAKRRFVALDHGCRFAKAANGSKPVYSRQALHHFVTKEHIHLHSFRSTFPPL
ncbi:hypothetical protein [Herminiimonas arsenitoxidans]|uniref:hypothetical protein n=1 Tax=Herminiimonas arsenitoxidans TaxID=1809410 RepID=UPI0012FF9373|nr:hypothetical protein [Herminiimonas arsenitoxidans]